MSRSVTRHTPGSRDTEPRGPGTSGRGTLCPKNKEKELITSVHCKILAFKRILDNNDDDFYSKSFLSVKYFCTPFVNETKRLNWEILAPVQSVFCRIEIRSKAKTWSRIKVTPTLMSKVCKMSCTDLILKDHHSQRKLGR